MTGDGGRRILLIGMHYLPEVTGNAPYTSGLAEHLVARGDDVTMLAGLPHYPTWQIARGTRRALFQRETIRGVTVIRAAHYVPSAQSALGRVLHEGTFALTALLASVRLPQPDAILGIIPNLSSGVIARVTADRMAAPYGLLFQNLMGQAARQSGMGGGATAAKAISAVETWAMGGARAIGVVTQTFIPYLVARGVDQSQIHLVPNWTRITDPSMSVAETRARFGWADDEQVVLHAGNMGVMQGLGQVVDAARIAAARRDPVRFILCGGGSQSGAIHSAAKGLPNVTFLGVQPDGIHASLLRAADVLLLSELPTEVDTSLPSKLTSYFAAGRPIVAAIPPGGSSAREIGRSGAGILVPAGDPESLLGALASLRADTSLAADLARAGPTFAAAHTSAAACLDRASDLVDAIADRRPAALGTFRRRTAS